MPAVHPRPVDSSTTYQRCRPSSQPFLPIVLPSSCVKRRQLWRTMATTRGAGTSCHCSECGAARRWVGYATSLRGTTAITESEPSSAAECMLYGDSNRNSYVICSEAANTVQVQQHDSNTSRLDYSTPSITAAVAVTSSSVACNERKRTEPRRSLWSCASSPPPRHRPQPNHCHCASSTTILSSATNAVTRPL